MKYEEPKMQIINIDGEALIISTSPMSASDKTDSATGVEGEF